MFNTIAALGIIGIQITIVVTIIGWATKAPFVALIARYAGLLIASLFTAAAIMSFVYQYGFGYEPCLLCWYQRIAIFPIAILGWMANIRTEVLLQKQILVLSVAGLLVAAFHIYIDIFPTGLDVCGATGPSCLVRYVYEFGYITIPVMSFTVLAAGALLALLAKCYPQDNVVTIK
jgi:disulfide bond formation protein DsbB